MESILSAYGDILCTLAMNTMAVVIFTAVLSTILTY